MKKKSETWTFSRNAMASEFTITIHGVDFDEAGKAANAGFREIELVENALSRFRYDSDTSRINALKPGEEYRPSLIASECLALARETWMATAGAFDPTIGALLAWRAKHPRKSKVPNEILSICGMDKLLSNENHTVIGVAVEGLRVDLGAIGKGYGVDRAAELLRRDWDVPAGIVQGGESSIRAWGDGPGKGGWSLYLRDPTDQENILSTITLHDFAMSGSGQVLHGDHIIDPRSGQRAPRDHAAWACSPNAAIADALSTAMMVLSQEEIGELFNGQREIGGLVHFAKEERTQFGIWGQWGLQSP
ncbi:MAG: FAD:protein FMN transferase [Candidatus Sumerlaeia bacterium]|nr:FAD:protein FMN transferase [Candidatus Sumerlaeia bacterium]